jgi:hypothetical protein
VLVRSIVTRRKDSEGFRDIDIAANHCARVSKWKAQLTFKEETAWAIFRGGATWTPTRRYFGAGRDPPPPVVGLAHVAAGAESGDDEFPDDDGIPGADGESSEVEEEPPAAELGDDNDGSTSCPKCGFARCSFRHLVVECPALEEKRCEVTARYSLAHDWLQNLPHLSFPAG